MLQHITALGGRQPPGRRRTDGRVWCDAAVRTRLPLLRFRQNRPGLARYRAPDCSGVRRRHHRALVFLIRWGGSALRFGWVLAFGDAGSMG